MLRPLCFAKWDKIFDFSGQQWVRKQLPAGVPTASDILFSALQHHEFGTPIKIVKGT
jgi:hypothetical protein